MSEQYKIQIWKDVPNKKEWNESKEDGTIETHIIDYMSEEKVANIGSNTMTSLNRAINPRLVNNINGTNTFSFLLYYTYIDTKTGEKVKNPFVNLITNETKIKVYWKEKWYDFVIKNIQESSDGKSIQYSCTDLYINELSKTGFNLEFNSELNNNQGTIQELGEAILEGSDWQLGTKEIIQQELEEPVYELRGVELPSEFSAIKPDEKTTITIPSNSTILLYYSVLRDRSTYLQFFYNGKNSFKRESSDLLTEDGECLYVDKVTWEEKNEIISGKSYTYINCYLNTDTEKENPILHIPKTKNISTNYRAKRLVRAVKGKFDSLTKKNVTLYNYKDKEIYKYIDNEYLDPTIVQNLVINSKDFSNLDGWLAVGQASIPFFQLYPPFSNINVNSESYLKIGKGKYYNTAFQTNSSAIINGIQPKQKFIFRIQAYTNETDENQKNEHPSTTLVTSDLSFYVKKYNAATHVPSGNNYFSSIKGPEKKNGWLEWTVACDTAATAYELMYENIGLFIENTYGTCWIKEVQFFPLVYGEKIVDGKVQKDRINPGDLDAQAIIQPVYKYYDPSANTGVSDPKKIKYLYVDTVDWTTPTPAPTPIYNENFEKIRSITEKNSNRFNLLQTLAETFECWVRFNIEHNDDGSIVTTLDKTNQKVKYAKTITFEKEIGKQIGIGFKYGIDLNTIERTINSEQIATKVIVTPNSNEYGENGFCSIARSRNNYSKENFILNFDYYISHGLLNGGELNKDLYLTTSDAIGYYYHLNQNNIKYDNNVKKLKLKEQDLLKQESFKVTYSEYIVSATQQKQEAYNDLLKYTGAKTQSGINYYLNKHPDDKYSKSLSVTYSTLKRTITTYQNQLKKLNTSITKLTTDITNLKKAQDNLLKANKALHEKFNNKYSRYIQEGSWISEDYVNDDLYYMDAVSVAYTSSRPQVSYNISVLRLSALEKFKNKVFKVGDISYIEDTEFFGYVNGTPYRELVLISEISTNFDDPAKDTITVQNYRTQFEDLFQRITATTQSLQYNQGGYKKAADAFEEDGTIKVETLQNSIAYNQEIISSSQNESIIKDSTGMTFTDINNPNKKTKITSGGVFISTDGGNTWKNAIRGDGLSTQYLTAGSINANNITILDGNHTTFRWDSRGINAFSIFTTEVEDSTNPTGKEQIMTVNLAKFVRFDHYGIYGIDGDSDFEPKNEDDIWNKANFGMTWKGFFVKNRADNGWVEVSSLNDIAVYSGTSENNVERIKIGRLGKQQSATGNETESNNYVYGIRISNADGKPVMETNSDGTLWLKKELNISSTNNQKIKIGYLDSIKNEKDENGKDIHETINVYDKFIVYEDGSMVATKGNFTGTINATGGSIGGLTIEQIVSDKINFELTSNQGLVVDQTVKTITLTAHAYKGDYGSDGYNVTEDYEYTWFVNGINQGISTGNTYELSLNDDITTAYFVATLKSKEEQNGV